MNFLTLQFHVCYIYIGYNCKFWHCIGLQTEENDTVVIIRTISHWLPCILMTCSYTIIWVHICTQGTYLKQVARNDVKRMLAKRELQFAKSFFMIVFIYFICVVPMTLLNLINPEIFAKNPSLCRISVFLWYLQYSLNFFVYAATSEQYRKAYLFFFQEVSIYKNISRVKSSGGVRISNWWVRHAIEWCKFPPFNIKTAIFFVFILNFAKNWWVREPSSKNWWVRPNPSNPCYSHHWI